MKIFNIIAGISSIVGLLISIFIANRVYKISNKIDNSKNNNNKQKQKFENNHGKINNINGNRNSVK